MEKIITKIDSRGVAKVTLNNPSKHNAFDDYMINQLCNAFTAIAENSDVRLMILASEGQSFSAGADLDWMKRMAAYSYEENLEDAKALAGMLKMLSEMPQPTIARVQGALGLISCCDIAVAATTATFALSEVKIGLVPATISPYVIAAIGERYAKRYFMTAERFDSNTALQMSLVHETVEEQQLDKKIEQVVCSVLNNGPEAAAAAKQLISTASGKAIDSSLIEHTCEVIAGIRVSAQGQEGLSAFLEKRQPNWLKD